jgi:hypothetical protein
MRRTITLGLLLCLVGSLSVVGLAAADSGTSEPDLLNGSATFNVEPDGQIVVDGTFTETATTQVNVTAAEAITVNTSSGTVNVTSGTQIFTDQNNTLAATVDSNYSGSVTDTVTLTVTGDNLTKSTTGTLTQDSFNVTVSVADPNLAGLNSTSVSVTDPGFFGGFPGFGEDSETGRNLLIGGILVLVGYLYLRDE